MLKYLKYGIEKKNEVPEPKKKRGTRAEWVISPRQLNSNTYLIPRIDREGLRKRRTGTRQLKYHRWKETAG